MTKVRITIDITSENDDYENSIHEAMKGILNGNRSGRGENDIESYEFSVSSVYD